MLHRNVRITVCVTCGLLLWAAFAVRGVQAQSLEEKLGTITDYVPKAVAPVDQLVEVAQKFKIPMGIEWVERAYPSTPDKTALSGKRSVKELIEEIAGLSPGNRMEVADGIVRIYAPAEAIHPFNFLNIRLRDYDVKQGDLFAAEDQLRWAIRFALEPEKYANGFAGGYGHGANHVFEIPKFTLSGSDLTIREVLNRIALAQGNALWVATIKSADLTREEPYWKLRGVDDGDLPVTSAWRFFPLADIAELAKDRLAIDVRISGMLDQRMTTIPIMLEEGLSGDSGGLIGGGSSEGDSYEYAAGIESIGKDYVMISLHLRVRHRGEFEFKFDGKVQVSKHRMTDISFGPRIRIRAYFERAEQR
jgi:hypothetical protein